MDLLQSYKENYLKTIKESHLKSLPTQDIIDSDLDLAAEIWNNYKPSKTGEYYDDYGYKEYGEFPLTLEEKYQSIDFKNVFKKYLEDEKFLKQIINKTDYDLIFLPQFQNDNPQSIEILKKDQELIKKISHEDKRGFQLIDFQNNEEKIQYYLSKPHLIDEEIIKGYSNNKYIYKSAVTEKSHYMQYYQYLSDDIKKSVEYSVDLLNSAPIEIYEYFSDEMKKNSEVRKLYVDKRIEKGISLKEFASFSLEEKNRIFKIGNIVDNFNIIDSYVSKFADEEFLKILIDEFVNEANKYTGLFNRRNVLEILPKIFASLPDRKEKAEKMIAALESSKPNTPYVTIVQKIVHKDKELTNRLKEGFYFKVYQNKKIEKNYIKSEDQLQKFTNHVFSDLRSQKISEDTAHAWILFAIDSCSIDLLKKIGKARKNSYEYMKKAYQVKTLSEEMPINNNNNSTVKAKI